MLTSCNGAPETAPLPGSGLNLATLESLTVERLRERNYGTTIRQASRNTESVANTYLAEYDSDGLRVLTRIDMPAAAHQDGGMPVLVFLHGWVGIDGAPAFDFYLGGDSWYEDLIRQYVAEGYVVLTPGFRGHGGADGIEYLAAWDNGSYLSPVFYAVDVLNLVAGIDTLPAALDDFGSVSIDTNRIFLAGHSQGGDVALIVCAVSGEGSGIGDRIAGVSIVSGTFVDRLTQLETYYPMQTSPEAFVAGDGSWNATAVGKDGSSNANFVFGYPPDWIGTPNQHDWTWQTDAWSLASVSDAWTVKLEEMYKVVDERVADQTNPAFVVSVDTAGNTRIVHDGEVAAAMADIGAYHLPQYLSEPLHLHYSDRDFYSIPKWNRHLCQQVNAAGGSCEAYEYPGTNHSLRVSEHEWFSPPGTVDGLQLALSRDVERFNRIGADTGPDAKAPPSDPAQQ